MKAGKTEVVFESIEVESTDVILAVESKVMKVLLLWLSTEIMIKSETDVLFIVAAFVELGLILMLTSVAGEPTTSCVVVVCISTAADVVDEEFGSELNNVCEVPVLVAETEVE